MTRLSPQHPVALAMLVISAPPALAHPDIAASAAVSFEVQEGDLLALSELVVFDDATSRRLRSRFDANGDGLMSQGEMTELTAELLARLRARKFYTEVTLENAQVDLPEPTHVAFQFDRARLTLRVTFRLSTPVDLRGRPLDVLMRDRDLVVAFALGQVPPAISGDAGACTARVEQRPDEAYFGGLVTPDVVTLTCR